MKKNPSVSNEKGEHQDQQTSDKKAYQKPSLTRFGDVQSLTAAGNPGTLMDNRGADVAKTGF